MIQTNINNGCDIIIDTDISETGLFEIFLSRINFKTAEVYGFLTDAESVLKPLKNEIPLSPSASADKNSEVILNHMHPKQKNILYI